MDIEKVNIEKLSFEDLRALHAKIGGAITERQAEEVKAAREQILAIAHGAGISVQELIGVKGAKGIKMRNGASAPVPVKFRNPDNPEQGWSGRGRQPVWMKEYTAAGRNLDEARVS